MSHPLFVRSRTGGWPILVTLVALAAIATLDGPAVRSATLTTFTVDPSRSHVTFSATLTDNGTVYTLVPQVPGSDMAGVQGQIDVDLSTPGQIATRFPWGSLTLVGPPGNYQPGNLPADVAGSLLDIPPGGPNYIAMRNSQLSASLTAPVAADGTFPVANLRFRFSQGTVDIFSPAIGGNLSISNVGFTLTDLSLDSGRLLAISPTTLELHLPVITHSTALEPLLIDVNGEVVAVAHIPEPATGWLILAGGGALGLGWARPKRRIGS